MFGCDAPACPWHGHLEGQCLPHVPPELWPLVLSTPQVSLLGNVAAANTEIIICSPGNDGLFKRSIKDSKLKIQK